MRIHLLLCVAAFAAVLVVLSVHAQDKKKTEPQPVPTLKIKMDPDGKGIKAYHGDTGYKLDGSRPSVALCSVLQTFVAHEDKALGYAGKQSDVSANVLSLEIAPGVPQRAVSWIAVDAFRLGTRKFVFGTSGLNAKPLEGPRAPDLKKLPAGYIAVEIKDEEPPSVPKERIRVYIRLDSDSEQVEAIVALDARARRVVPNSAAKLVDLAPADGDSAERSKSKQEARDKWVTNVAAYVEDYVVNSGARIEIIEIDSRGGVGPDLKDRSEPGWMFTDLAYRAGLLVNKNREEQGNTALQILLPFQIPMAEPPPPEELPEKEVEFPKDEPQPDKKGATPKGEDSGDEGDSDAENAVQMQRSKALAASADRDRIVAALNWLRDHQSPDGRWSATAFRDHSARENAATTGNVEFVKQGNTKGDLGWEDAVDIGLTGLAMLAFSAAGEHHRSGDYRATIRNALRFLRMQQQNDGCFGSKKDDHFVYNHAFASCALADLFSITGDMILSPMIAKACEFILKAQNPGFGWRYGVQPGVSDSSVTGIMVMALWNSRQEAMGKDLAKAYSAITEKQIASSMKDSFAWYELVTVKVDNHWKTGYDTPGSNNARLRIAQEYHHNPTLDAIHGVCALKVKNRASKKYLSDFRRSLREAEMQPAWKQLSIDYYYWYWATTYLCLEGGTDWKKWNEKVCVVLKDHQRGWHKVDAEKSQTTPDALDEHGSWDAVGAWWNAGGRVYSTALGALILQTEWRVSK